MYIHACHTIYGTNWKKYAFYLEIDSPSFLATFLDLSLLPCIQLDNIEYQMCIVTYTWQASHCSSGLFIVTNLHWKGQRFTSNFESILWSLPLKSSPRDCKLLQLLWHCLWTYNHKYMCTFTSHHRTNSQYTVKETFSCSRWYWNQSPLEFSSGPTN